MKYLGEVFEKVVQKVRKTEYMRCDKCHKKILPRQEFVYVKTHHNDWGNDSVDSFEYYDLCHECAKEFVNDYVSKLSGTECIEIENSRFFTETVEEKSELIMYENGFSFKENDKFESEDKNAQNQG